MYNIIASNIHCINLTFYDKSGEEVTLVHSRDEMQNTTYVVSICSPGKHSTLLPELQSLFDLLLQTVRRTKTKNDGENAPKFCQRTVKNVCL